MRIDIIAPAMPPKLDGIGDYTANLVTELSRTCRVRVLTVPGPHTPIEGVKIEAAFRPDVPRSVGGLASLIEADPPDCLLLQFNQFSYGRWGWNPYLPQTLRTLRRRLPQMRQVVMMHEDFVPLINWKFAIMTTWQRSQFRALGRNADAVLFSIDPWANRYRHWFRGKPVHHLPVGSNIPDLGTTRAEARARLGIGDDTDVIGLFGTAHATRLLSMGRDVVEAAVSAGRKTLILYIGPHGGVVQEAMHGHRMITEGPLPAGEVSRRLPAIDVYLAPYLDGVSTRRGAMMAGIQHGLATVGTAGPLTDQVIKDRDGSAILLADVNKPDAFVAQSLRLLDDISLRRRIGNEARAWYNEEFAWPRIADRLLKFTLRGRSDSIASAENAAALMADGR